MLAGMDGATTARTPLQITRLREGLTAGSAARWSRVDVVEETGSTNADLLAGAADLPDRTVLLAEYQVRGRGRHNRSFVAPPRSQVAVSTLIDLGGIDPAGLGWLPLLTGVVVTDTVRALGVDARLKWPNDVLVEGRKIAGILVEVAPGGRAVIGVGLNVHLSEEELPVPTATSLDLVGAGIDRAGLDRAGVDGTAVDRTEVAIDYLRRLADRIDAWRDDARAGADVAADYRLRCSTIGLRVRVELPGDEELIGTARDVDRYGRLLVVDDRGVDTAVSAGDVTHVRPV